MARDDGTLHCLQEGPDCTGEVTMVTSADRDDFKAFPRCEYHAEQRHKQAEETLRKYPMHAPADFDPTYAGERWDDEY